MKSVKILVSVCLLFTFLIFSSCKRDVCLNCQKTEVGTNVVKGTANVCGKDKSEAYKKAFDQLPQEEGTIVGCAEY